MGASWGFGLSGALRGSTQPEPSSTRNIALAEQGSPACLRAWTSLDLRLRFEHVREASQ